jgi:hypothetical protein
MTRGYASGGFAVRVGSRGAGFSRFLWLAGGEGESHWQPPDPAPYCVATYRTTLETSPWKHLFGKRPDGIMRSGLRRRTRLPCQNTHMLLVLSFGSRLVRQTGSGR